MVLECIGSDSVGITYQRPVYTNRLLLSKGTIGATGITYTSLKNYYGTTDDFFSWTIEERTWDREWRAIGTLSIYTSTGWDNEHWCNVSPVNSADHNLIVIQALDGTWSTQTANLDGLAGEAPRTAWVIITGSAPYNRSIERGQVFVPNGELYAYWDLSRVSVYVSEFYARSVEITHVFRMPNSRWNVSVYKNNVQIDTIIVQGDPSDPFNPPPIIAAPCPGTMYSWGENYSKLPDTQAIEVTISPLLSHRKLVWLVDLNASGIETSRKILSILDNCPGQPPVQHSILCRYPGQCPPDTCEVDCGTYVCCYDSQGISVFSYDK